MQIEGKKKLKFEYETLRTSHLHKVLPKPWFYAISGPQAFSLRGIDLIK